MSTSTGNPHSPPESSRLGPDRAAARLEGARALSLAEVENLRRSKRETLVTAAVLWPVNAPESDPGIRVFIANISMHGVAFRSRTPFEKGALYYIRLTAGPLRLENLVKIQWSRQREDTLYEIGSQFIDIPGEPCDPAKKPA